MQSVLCPTYVDHSGTSSSLVHRSRRMCAVVPTGLVIRGPCSAALAVAPHESGKAAAIPGWSLPPTEINNRA